MTPATLKLSLATAGCVLVAVLLWGFILHEREVGALRFQLSAADSVHRVDSLAHDSVSSLASSARAAATKAAEAAAGQVAKARALEATTRAAAKAAGDERDEARRILADSLATVGVYRETIGRLIASGQADSTATAAQYAAYQGAIRALHAALVSDSTAIQRGVAAENAAIKRAVDAEAQVRVLKRLRPSTFGGWAKVGGAVGVGYLAALALK